MANEQIIAQPTAGFGGLPPEAREAGMEQITREPAAIPSLGQILFGDTRRINNFDIPEETIEAARQKNPEALNFIRQQIDIAQATQAAFAQEVKIAGTERDPETGMLVAAAPEGMEGPAAEELQEYGAERLRLNKLLQGSGVEDPRVQQIINDYFYTGEMFIDTGRQLAEFPRFAGKAPDWIWNWLGSYASAAAEAAFDENIDFDTAWYNRQDNIARSSAGYEKFFRDNIGALTYGQSLNETVKKKFIEQYGEEEYNRVYRFDPGIEGVEPIDAQIISDELGDSLLKFSFQELPIQAQFGSFLLQNLPVTTAFGLRHVSKGKKMLEKVQTAKAADRTLRSLDDVTAYRLIRVEDANSSVTKSLRRFQGRVGQRFNYSGAIGNVTENQKAQTALKKVRSEVDRVTKEIRAEKLGAADPTRLKTLQGELNMLTSRQNRLVFKGAGNPYMFNLAVDEGVIAIGQTAGYNLLSQLDGIEADTGGMIGALSFAFVGKPVLSAPIRVAKLPRKTQVGIVFTDMMRTIEDVSGLIPLVPDMRGVFVNRQFDQLETVLGRPLTSQEAASFRAVADLMTNLDSDQREAVFNGMKNYNDVRTRIINAFPEDQRQEAAELFTLAFGNISGISALQAMEVSAFGKLRGRDMDEAMVMQNSIEENVAQADFAVNRLREMLQESGVNTADSQVAFAFFDSIKQAADGVVVEMADRKREYLGLLRDYRDAVIRDPLADVDTDFISRMSDLEIKMTPGALQDIAQQKAIVENTIQEVRAGLNERYANIKALRGTPAHRRELAKAVELTYDTHMDAVYARGKLAYENANQALEGEVIDIGDFVQQFVDEMGRLEGEQLKGIFDPSRDFFNSRSGRLAYSAFNDMAVRSLRKEGFDDKKLEEFKRYMQNTMPEYAGKDISPMDVALHLRETSDLNPFTGNAFEIDTVYRHFRNMGQRMTDDAKARPFKEAASSIDSLIMGHPKVGPVMADTRKQYQSEVFDRKRPGSIGDRIDNSRTGPEYADASEGGFLYPYKSGMTPDLWHSDFVDNIGRAIEGSKFSEDVILNSVEDLTRFWSDDFVDGKFVFDTTTEAGQQKLTNLRNMLQASLHEQWGSRRLKDMGPGLFSAKRGKIASQTGYNFDVVGNIQRLEDELVVSVRTADGQIEQQPLLDFTDILKEENDIADLVAKSDRLEIELNQFTDVVNGRIADSSDEITVLANLRKRDVSELESLTNMRDPQQFYRQYVENGNVSEIQHLRQNFVRSLTEQGVEADEATRRFNDGMVYMITNGLLKKGQVQASPKATFKSLTGERRTMQTMLDPASLMADIDNPNVIEILEDIGMESDHIRYLSDIAEFMSIAGGVQKMPGYRAKGEIRGISPNEVISRSFNLARGMVSPTYVAAEFAFRLMQQNNMSAIGLAASDKNAAEIILKIMEAPEEITDRDIRVLTTLAQSFIVREAVDMGITVDGTFIPVDPIEAAKQEEMRKQSEQGAMP